MTLLEPPSVTIDGQLPGSLLIPEIVTRLADRGFHPDSIADTLGLPAIQVRQLLIQHHRLPLEDQAIVNKTRGLITRVIDEAYTVLDYGTQADKISIMKSILPLVSRLMGKEEDTSTEMKTVFEEMYAQMRRTGVVETDVVDIPEDDAG